MADLKCSGVEWSVEDNALQFVLEGTRNFWCQIGPAIKASVFEICCFAIQVFVASANDFIFNFRRWARQSGGMFI